MKAILTYHSLDDSGSAISVPPEVFRRQMTWLASGPVRVLPLEKLLAVDAGVQAVALTFDDAFENFATVAAPVLARFDLPATLFVVADHVGKDNAWGGKARAGIPTLPLLDWDALGRLAEGGIDLGNHTRTHPNLARLPVDAVREELHSSHEAIAVRTGVKCRSVAYPYGRDTPTAVSLAGALYPMGVTTELRPLSVAEDALRLPRLDMYYFRAQERLEAWGTRRFDRRLWLRRQARRLRWTLATAGRRA